MTDVIDIFKNKPKEIFIPPETNEEKIENFNKNCDTIMENFSKFNAYEKNTLMLQIMESHKVLFKSLVIEMSRTKIERN